MRSWKRFERGGVTYSVNLIEVNDGIKVEVYSREPLPEDREMKRYIVGILAGGRITGFHGDERVDSPDQTGDPFPISKGAFSGTPSYEGMRSAFRLGAEEAQRRLRTGAR